MKYFHLYAELTTWVEKLFVNKIDEVLLFLNNNFVSSNVAKLFLTGVLLIAGEVLVLVSCEKKFFFESSYFH
jgi:hypothetical protein